MTTNSQIAQRRGLGITAAALGVIAILLIVQLFVVSQTTQGQGLTTLALLAIAGYYASVLVGIAAMVVGVIGIRRSSAKVLSWIGLILGLVPLVGLLGVLLNGTLFFMGS